MNLKLDITSKNSFAIWEWGSWNPHKGKGSAHIVGDQNSRRLRVLFDRDPTRSYTHALMYANIGYVVAGCFIRRERNLLNCHVEFSRIETLSTKLVSVVEEGEEPDPLLTSLNSQKAAPEATTTVLYVARKLVPRVITSAEDQVKLLIKELLDAFPKPEELPDLPFAREMMKLVIEKAYTPDRKQRVFYGVTRAEQKEYSLPSDEDIEDDDY